MSESRLWVLGAADPEMVGIERLLSAAHDEFAYAVVTSGDGHVRVHPGNAYRATGFSFPGDPKGYHHGPAWGEVTHMVECGSEHQYPDGDGLVVWRPMVADHHRPGDAGFGLPPAEFLSASSVGQVVLELVRLDCGDAPFGQVFGSPAIVTSACEANPCPPSFVRHDDGWYVEWCPANGSIPCQVAVRSDIVLAAAADHCLMAAYRGQCPGVDPDELMKWRVNTRANFQGRTSAQVMDDIEAARKRLREAVTLSGDVQAIPAQAIEVGGGPLGIGTLVADFRGESIPELPEAACREGIPFVSSVEEKGGREKVVLQAASEGLVRLFLAGEIVSGLVDLYGDPARGFAGGYLAE